MRRSILTLVMALIISGCGGKYPDYNYKMTIHVGENAYSSVRGIETEEVTSIVDSSGSTVKTKVTGEAVIMDLPSGQTVYALLSRPDNADYAKYIVGAALSPHRARIAGEVDPDKRASADARQSNPWDEGADKRRAMLEVEGPRDLPRTLPARNGRPPFQAWPFFVTFDDPKDPKTVREVSPSSIGVDRITIEITDEDVTTGIEERLPPPDRGRYGRPTIVNDRQVVAVMGVEMFRQGSDK